MENFEKPLVDPLYKSIFPDYPTDQKERLRDSLIEKGQLETIKYSDRSKKIVDGYTRLELLEGLGVEPKYEMKHFDSDAGEIMYVLTVNLNRRSNSTYSEFESVYRFVDLIKKQVRDEGIKFREGRRGKVGEASEAERKMFYTDSRIAEMLKVSSGLVEQMKVISKYGDDETRGMVRREEMSIGAAFEQIQAQRMNNREPTFVKSSTKANSLVSKGTESGSISTNDYRNMHHLAKMDYRSEFGILVDVLFTLKNGGKGEIISAISRKVNLSHYAALEKCAILENAGLVRDNKTGRNRMFSITPDGIELAAVIEKFSEQLKKYKMDKYLGDSSLF